MDFFGKFINSDFKIFCKILILLVINVSEIKVLLVYCNVVVVFFK